MEDVNNFMEACGQTETTHDLKNDKLVNFRMSLIDEEVGELREALKNKDRTEVIDALADILFVVYGAGKAFDIDLDKAFDIVYESNMSKFCNTEEEAQATVDYYHKNKETLGYDSPAYRQYGYLWIVYNKSTGKILKSINYTPAKFAGL
jgi:predicted HAD superfamily Cof-like phosphohydrolase